MAKYNIFSVRDQLNGFALPICDFNGASATRNFKAALFNPDFVCPGDYDLYLIGTFDSDTGMIIPEEHPLLIYRGIDVRKELTASVPT